MDLSLSNLLRKLQDATTSNEKRIVAKSIDISLPSTDHLIAKTCASNDQFIAVDVKHEHADQHRTSILLYDRESLQLENAVSIKSIDCSLLLPKSKSNNVLVRCSNKESVVSLAWHVKTNRVIVYLNVAKIDGKHHGLIRESNLMIHTSSEFGKGSGSCSVSVFKENVGSIDCLTREMSFDFHVLKHVESNEDFDYFALGGPSTSAKSRIYEIRSKHDFSLMHSITDESLNKCRVLSVFGKQSGNELIDVMRKSFTFVAIQDEGNIEVLSNDGHKTVHVFDSVGAADPGSFHSIAHAAIRGDYLIAHDHRHRALFVWKMASDFFDSWCRCSAHDSPPERTLLFGALELGTKQAAHLHVFENPAGDYSVCQTYVNRNSINLYQFDIASLDN